MRKIVVRSPANIAFIKYWGQKDKKQTLPYNDSFSMNLSNCFTELTLEILNNKSVQELFIREYKSNVFVKADDQTLEKVRQFYFTAKRFLKSGNDFGFRLSSANSFPKKAGIASSASFFSALALAFTAAFDKQLPLNKLSMLARLSGSGSACRSIPDGFSWWHNSYAVGITTPSYWQLVDLVLILSYNTKKVGSQEGHKGAETSPFFKLRIRDLKKRLKDIKTAFLKKDLSWFGRLIEEEAISMHMVMMTQNPPLYFWSGRTIEIIKKTVELRKSRIEAYFTIDAGENVHIICQKKDMNKIYDYFIKQPEVCEIIKNEPAVGSRVKIL